MRQRNLLLGSCALLLACTDIIPSVREEAYEYRRFFGTQELSIRWERADMPLRIFVAADNPLYAHVQTAITRWENALLYGEFKGVIVDDSTEADIIVRNISPDEAIPAEMRLSASATQCSGDTDLDLEVEALTVHAPLHIYVYPNGSQQTGEALETCLRLTTTHELGHALGILQHSIRNTDIMFTNPILDGLSTPDKQTMEQVFHSLPTLRIVRDE